MQPGNRRWWRIVAVVVLFASALSAQAILFSAGHRHSGLESHTCALCHTAHLASLQPSGVLLLETVLAEEWSVANRRDTRIADPGPIARASRAPPFDSPLL